MSDRPRVYFDVAIGRRPAGRLVFELYAHVAPKTCANFRAICAGDARDGLTYEGCPFHRVIPGFMVQGGDITRGDGTGGDSIYGRAFRDEALRKSKIYRYVNFF